MDPTVFVATYSVIMRNYDISQRHLSQRQDAEILPPLPAPSHSGLTALRAIIPCLLSWLRVHLGQRGSASMAKRVEASLRRLYAKEKDTMVVLIKKALRSCPEWRARVFEDLGGEAALARWEARLLRAITPPPEEDYSWLDDDPDDWVLIDSISRTHRSESPSSKGPRLDRDGLFRWARIKQGPHERYQRAPRAAYAPPTRHSFSMLRERGEREMFKAPWPIEVGPSDLIDVFEPDEIIILNHPPATYWDANMQKLNDWQRELISYQTALPERAAACLIPD